MKKPKYIITADNELRMGWVDFHSDLIEEQPAKIIGGGWWVFLDEDKTEILLFGLSVDYGHLTTEQIESVFSKGKLPTGIDTKVEKVFYSTQIRVADAKENKKLLMLREVASVNS